MSVFSKDGSMVNKTTVTAFVFGIIAAVFVFHAYTVYQVRATVAQNQAVLNQVVNVLQQAGAAQGQALQQRTQQAPQSAVSGEQTQ